MRPARVKDKQLIDRLTNVFRLHGYDGASISRISKATGLERASLYHRFPGGKEEMVQTVLERADDWFERHILAPLEEPGNAKQNIKTMAQRLKEFYSFGQKSCLLDSLSFGDDSHGLQEHIQQSFAGWIDALAQVSRQTGLKPKLARQRAEEAVLRIQGALVLARGTGDTKPFLRILESLPDFLTSDQIQR